MPPSLRTGGGAVLNFSDRSGLPGLDQAPRAEAGEARDLAAEMGLVGVAELRGDARELLLPADDRRSQRDEAPEAKHPVERLRPVSDRLAEDPPQVPLAHEERIAQRSDAAGRLAEPADRSEDERIRGVDLRKPAQDRLLQQPPSPSGPCGAIERLGQLLAPLAPNVFERDVHVA